MPRDDAYDARTSIARGGVEKCAFLWLKTSPCFGWDRKRREKKSTLVVVAWRLLEERDERRRFHLAARCWGVRPSDGLETTGDWRTGRQRRDSTWATLNAQGSRLIVLAEQCMGGQAGTRKEVERQAGGPGSSPRSVQQFFHKVSPVRLSLQPQRRPVGFRCSCGWIDLADWALQSSTNSPRTAARTETSKHPTRYGSHKNSSFNPL